MIAFTAPPILIEIVDGDIAAERVDAVVNAANNHFWMGAGVAGALKARGGPEIERDAMAQGPVEPGACVITGGYRLPARHVIHAAVMGQDLRTSAEIIERATSAALQLAAREHVDSIAFPALGTGVGGFSTVECAAIMIGAAKAFSSSAGSLGLIRFVLFGHSAYRAFSEVAGELLGPPLAGPPDCPLSS
ncbi:MAG TPA: macro domain-containing protein [Vicinamibacterales bacterium]